MGPTTVGGLGASRPIPATLPRQGLRRGRVSPRVADFSALAPKPPRGAAPSGTVWRVPLSEGWAMRASPGLIRCWRRICATAGVDDSGDDEGDGYSLGADEYPAVVKIHVTKQEPDWQSPWQAKAPRRSSGSGVLIRKGPGGAGRGGLGPSDASNVVLTAAHVVADATFVQIQLSNGAEKYVARVLRVSHESDLALLEVCPLPDGIREGGVADPFEGVEPMPIAPEDALPSLRDKVYVLGFPVGGIELSITEGVVSRVEVQTYSHSKLRLLATTVDAAINSGNSGGPVLGTESRQVVGIAFQGYAGSDVENVGHMVPTPLIHHFLQGIERGDNTGIPALGIRMQFLENPSLREYLKMRATDKGVLVSSVEYGCSAWGILKVGDILLEVDGNRISNDGTIMLYGRFRTPFVTLLHQKYCGDSVSLTILRDGDQMVLSCALKPVKHLVPYNLYDTSPSFLLVGGLLFQPLNRDYLRTWRDWKDAPTDLVELYYSGTIRPDRTEVVLLSQVLADETNVGYSMVDEVVKEVEGVKIRSLRHFAAIVDQRLNAGEGYLRMKSAYGSLIVLDVKELLESKERVLERYRIPLGRSLDLVDLEDELNVDVEAFLDNSHEIPSVIAGEEHEA